MQWQFVAFIWLSLFLRFETADVKFIAATRSFNAKYISNFTIFVGKDPNNLNLDITLTQPILKDFFALVDIQIRLKDSTRFQSLFVEDFDACELVNNVFIDNLMKKWWKNVLRYGNFMENCPVPEGHYFLRGLQVEQTSLAMYLRPGDYRIIGRGYYKKPGKMNDTVVGATLDVKWFK